MIHRPLRPSTKPLVRKTPLRAVGPRGEKRRAEYAKYLKSAVWRRIRDVKVRSVSYTLTSGVTQVRCQKCDAPLVVRCPDSAFRDRIHVHHTRYPKVLGTETLDMLAIRCDRCHREDHWYRRSA